METTEEHVEALAEDQEGGMWVCGRKGLLHYANHQWQVFLAGKEPGEFFPTGACATRRGGVWVGSKGMMTRFTREGPQEVRTVPFHRNKPKPIRWLTEDEDGSVWAADRYRLMHCWPDSNRWDLIMGTDNEDAWIHYLQRDTSGRVCFGGGWGCYRIEAGQPRLVAGYRRAPGGGIVTNAITAYCRSPQGHSWIATADTLTKVIESPDGGDPVVVGSVTHPRLTHIEHMTLDSEGNVWIGTVFDGAVMLHERRFQTLQPPAGYRSGNNVWSVCEDNQGSIWFGSHSGVYRVRGGVTEAITNSLVPIVQQVFCVWPDTEDGVWIGFGGFGLQRWRHTGWEAGPVFQNTGITRNEYNIRCLFTDRSNALWIGTPTGLYQWQSGRLTRFTESQGLPGNEVRAMVQDKDGSYWIGTHTRGISHMRNREFQNYSRQNGLADDEINCLHLDSEGLLWIGTGSGLTRLKNGVFKSLYKRNGLHDNLVNWLLEDDQGFFWISCNRGIFRISRAAANAVLDSTDPHATLNSMPFGEGDGMLSAETNCGGQPAGWKSRDGHLWFPSTRGLVQIDPTRVRPPQAPSVVVEQVIADSKVKYGDWMPATPPQKHSASFERWKNESTIPTLYFEAGSGRVLEIRYTANVFADAPKIHFQYFLEGHDPQWQEGGDRRLTHYTNLEPGRYVFKVRASNPYGVWGPATAILQFELGRFFYQTWWFYVACALAVVLVATGVQSYRLHIQRHILQLEKEHALEKERARIAKDMHDDLGARLTQLGLVSELVESPEFVRDPGSGGHLPKVSSLAREAVRSLDEIVWAVTPGKNSLDQLAGYLVHSAQDLISPSGIRFEVRMPPQVPPAPLTAELRHNVYLVVKEALNNAVKHSGAQRIMLEMVHGRRSAQFTLTDDGCGFDLSDAAGTGNGLANMMKRAENVGARIELRSHPGKGTSVSVQFALTSDLGNKETP
jgi:signal transduction histidine kinase/ligand-binding sensor domain-containing protein